MKKILFLTTLLVLLKTKPGAQTWSPVGTGIGGASYSAVYCLTSYNNNLIAGGYFSTAGGTAASSIAKWDGTTWQPLGAGISGDVQSLCVYDSALYVGGNFSMAGSTVATDIAKWNGSSWTSVGNPDCYTIKSLAVYNGALYAAGYFVGLTGPDGTSIAKWNGTSWSAVGTGPEPVINDVSCLAVYNGELYAAGTDIGGGGTASSYSVVKWNGVAWSSVLTMPAIITPDGAIGEIRSMAVYNGELYIAGMFTVIIGGVFANQVAKWNGIIWSAVGTGINFASWPGPGPGDGSEYTFVASLAVYNGSLFAGGRFAACGPVPTNNIAKFDGSSWQPVGQGANNFVLGMCVHDSLLYAGGSFTTVDSNIPANKIARWGCNGLPDQPLSITGSLSVCNGAIQVYSIPTVQGATTYTWTLPPGWTGNSNTNSINVTPGQNDGIISVQANNSCGSGAPQNISIHVIPLPAQPPTIYGDDSVCNGTQQNYSVDAISQATSYTWQLPQGWTGSSTTNIISLIAGPNSGSIAIKANNTCGSGQSKILFVTSATLPSQPSAINGNDSVYVNQPHTYSIAGVPGATDYNWTVTGGTIVNGQGSTSIVVTWDQPGNRSVSVNASNYCGASISQIKTVAVSSITGVFDQNNVKSLLVLQDQNLHKLYLAPKGYANKLAKVQLVNTSGQLVFQTQLRLAAGNGMQEINLANLLPGNYVVIVSIEKMMYKKKILLLN